MAKSGTEEAIVRAKPITNGDGDKTPGAVRFTAKNTIVWPRTSAETADRGIIVIDGLCIFFPAPVEGDILATDEITVRGKTWKVDGTAGDYRKANGTRVGHIVNVVRSGV